MDITRQTHQCPLVKGCGVGGCHQYSNQYSTQKVTKEKMTVNEIKIVWDQYLPLVWLMVVLPVMTRHLLLLLLMMRMMELSSRQCSSR